MKAEQKVIMNKYLPLKIAQCREIDEKVRRSPDITMKEQYEYYKEKLGEKALPKNIWSAVYKDLMRGIVDKLIFNNLQWRLPYGLGDIYIMKRKIKLKLDENGNLITKRLMKDWGNTLRMWRAEPETRKQKKYLYHVNKHTNGYRMRIFWMKTTVKVKNSEYYCFAPCVYFKQRLSRTLINKTPGIDFFEY